MAVKGTILKFQDAPSIDQRWKEQQGGAESIQNYRIDPQGDGWLADRGLEPWMKFDLVRESETSPYMDTQVDSQFIWTKQSTGQVYHFVEQGGELYYLWGHSDTVGAVSFWKHKVTIATVVELERLAMWEHNLFLTATDFLSSMVMISLFGSMAISVTGFLVLH